MKLYNRNNKNCNREGKEVAAFVSIFFFVAFLGIAWAATDVTVVNPVNIKSSGSLTIPVVVSSISGTHHLGTSPTVSISTAPFVGAAQYGYNVSSSGFRAIAASGANATTLSRTNMGIFTNSHLLLSSPYSITQSEPFYSVPTASINIGAGSTTGHAGVGSMLYLWDGSAWMASRGSYTNGLLTQGTVTIGNTAATPAPVTTANSTGFTTNRVTISTVATLIVATNTSRRSVIIENVGSTTFWIGNSTGTTTVIGKRVAADRAITIDRSTGAVYAIVSTGSGTADYLEE